MKNVTVGNLYKVLGLIKISSPYIDFYCQQHSKIFYNFWKHIEDHNYYFVISLYRANCYTSCPTSSLIKNYLNLLILANCYISSDQQFNEKLFKLTNT